MEKVEYNLFPVKREGRVGLQRMIVTPKLREAAREMLLQETTVEVITEQEFCHELTFAKGIVEDEDLREEVALVLESVEGIEPNKVRH